jgi:hypothetical protein
MKIEFIIKALKKVNMYLPFTLLFISTIIMTALAFLMLPLILAYLNLLSDRGVIQEQHNNAYT